MAEKLISVSEIEPGMVLAEPVKNRNGQILLNTGTFLEEKHKKLLGKFHFINIGCIAHAIYIIIIYPGKMGNRKAIG